MFLKRAAAGIALTVCLVASCTVRQEVTLRADGSGVARVDVEVKEFFASYLMDLAEFTGTEVDREVGLFDPQELREAIGAKDGVEVLEVERVSPVHLRMLIGFDSIEELMSSEQMLSETGILTLHRSGQRWEFRLHFDKQNFTQISALFPMVDQTLLQMFGPQEDFSISENEYLEMMSFALGEQGPPAIKESVIEAEVLVPGRIIAQSGGELEGSRVKFAIPLIKILLLEEPLDYSITYQ